MIEAGNGLKFRVIRKLGWGANASAWLAEILAINGYDVW
jgi:hypothetical protein